MKILTTILVCIILLIAGSCAAELMVITHPEVSVENLDQMAIRRIFLGKKIIWENGDIIIPVILTDKRVQQEFLKKIVLKTNTQFSTYWKRMTFTGQGVAPISFATQDEVVRYVRNKKGAIGYIDSRKPYKGVKVVPLPGK